MGSLSKISFSVLPSAQTMLYKKLCRGTYSLNSGECLLQTGQLPAPRVIFNNLSEYIIFESTSIKSMHTLVYIRLIKKKKKYKACPMLLGWYSLSFTFHHRYQTFSLCNCPSFTESYFSKQWNNNDSSMIRCCYKYYGEIIILKVW